ncbi:hypothetical protein CsSME_00011064 [Camellia sinensis var. sinensis]
MSNIKSSFLLLSTYHFLLEMIRKAVSKKLLTGFCLDFGKSDLENMINHLMLLSNIGCSLQKAMVVQWLCFTPTSTINDAQASSAKLLLRALLHSNILFREFALISMWRVPAMPIGAHTLLSFLVEPLKQPTELFFLL